MICFSAQVIFVVLNFILLCQCLHKYAYWDAYWDLADGLDDTSELQLSMAITLNHKQQQQQRL